MEGQRQWFAEPIDEQFVTNNGWLATPIREEHLEPVGRELGAFLRERLQQEISDSIVADLEQFYPTGITNNSNIRMERPSPRTYPTNGPVALPSPVHCWCGGVELYGNRRDGYVLAQLLLEGYRTSVRPDRPAEYSVY